MGIIEEITLAGRRDYTSDTVNVAPPRRHHRLNDPILRSKLPQNFCEEAARLILDRPGRVLILTGFFIAIPYHDPVTGGLTEADGPAGAVAIRNALLKLDYPVTVVTDKYGTICFEDLTGTDELVDFPIVGNEESKREAKALLDRLNPSVVIAIERPGLTADGKYYNARGWDISNFVAKLDYLMEHPATIGIIDVGNEIGGGNIAAYQELVQPPLQTRICLTRCDNLVFGGSCNSGGYALAAALSRLTQRNLLMSAQEEVDLIDGWTAKGVVDGSGNLRSIYDPALPTMNALLEQEGITAP